MKVGDRKHHIFHTAACTVAVIASALANPLRAEEAASASSFYESLLDRSTLTGNWGGARDDLAARGITITPSVTQFYQGPNDGKFESGSKAEAFLNINAAKLGLWDGFGIHVHGEYNFGQTPPVNGATFPNNPAMTFPVENQTGGDLTGVYFSQRFGSNFTLVGGKIDIFDLYGDAQKFNGGRGVERFMNQVFVAPPSGTVPVSMFGVIGSLKIDPFTFSLWVYDPRETLNRAIPENPFSEGVSVRGTVDLASKPFDLPRRDSFTVATSSEPGIDFTTLPDFGKFSDTQNFRNALINAFITQAIWGQNAQTYLPPQVQQSPPSEKFGRYYVSYFFEQTLWQSPADPNRSWGLFGQAAVSDGNPNSLQWSAFGGAGGTGVMASRPNDRFGLGFFYYGYSNELKDHLEPLITLADEYGCEFFYNFAVTKWFWLTADIQVITPAIRAQAVTLAPLTEVNNPTAAVFTLRSQIIF
jgi:porin